MRVTRTPSGQVLGVYVSRRNLYALIAKLNGIPPDSACTLLAPDECGPFFITAEEDAEHYHHPEASRRAEGSRSLRPPTGSSRSRYSRRRASHASVC
jgi:hypothetical protein